MLHMYILRFETFLSTPSARRATWQHRQRRYAGGISIHALREEGDGRPQSPAVRYFKFLSTPSARRATDFSRADVVAADISIHALREEGDRSGRCSSAYIAYFYPRPPRGGRQQKQRQNLYFQTNYTTFCTNLEEP